MAKIENWDKFGNIYFTEDGKTVDGVIDPLTGGFIPGVENVEDLADMQRDPFTNKPLPDIEAESMLPRVGKSMVKIFQYLWRAIFVIPIQYWLPIMGQWLTISGKFYGKKFIKYSKTMRLYIAKSNDLTPEIKETLNSMLESDDVGAVFTGILLSLPWYSMNVLSTFNILKIDNIKQKMAEFVPTMLDAPMYTNLLFRSPDRENEIKKYLGWLGLSEEQQGVLKETIRPLLDVMSLTQLKWRDDISSNEFMDGLSKLGYSLKDQEKLYKLIEIIPPVNDLVRFAVREAFTPEIISKYNLGSDFPEEFAKEAAKSGLSKDWALRYWYSHWELPPINLGFEMMHRGVIDTHDMDLLLRTKDVMPFWRDKITAVAYRPYSRVDVRRMFAAGVLSEDDVKRSYLDLGYDDNKASKMTAFTVAYTTGKEKELSKSDLLGAFTNNLISREDCQKELEQLGYSSESADILIKKAQFSKFKAKKELSLSNLRKLYFAGVYDDTDLINHLAVLRIGTEEINDLMELWAMEKSSAKELKEGVAEKDLSKSDILGAYKDAITDSTECRKSLMAMGYDENEAAILIKRIDVAKDKKVKELTISHIKKSFVLGLFDTDETDNALKEAGQSFQSRKDLISLWELELHTKVSKLAEPMLMKLLQNKIISKEDWIYEMLKIDYSQQHIDWLYELYTGTKL